MELVNVEKKGRIGIIVMNNQKALNALSEKFLGELNEAFDVVEADSEVDVVIITGFEVEVEKDGVKKMKRSFIAGADIKEMLPLTPAESIRWGKVGSDLNLRIENFKVPVIAAINGFCLGGGNELAMSCDIRIASDKASFGQPEVGLGITPGAGGTQRLARLVGAGIAKELIYTGRVIKPDEAYRIGLVNRVVPAEELMDTAIALAEEILKNSQVAVQQSKRCINFGLQTDIQTGNAFEQQAFAVTNGTEDKKIGMTAFVEKNPVKNFVGR